MGDKPMVTHSQPPTLGDLASSLDEAARYLPQTGEDHGIDDALCIIGSVAEALRAMAVIPDVIVPPPALGGLPPLDTCTRCGHIGLAESYERGRGREYGEHPEHRYCPDCGVSIDWYGFTRRWQHRGLA